MKKLLIYGVMSAGIIIGQIEPIEVAAAARVEESQASALIRDARNALDSAFTFKRMGARQKEALNQTKTLLDTIDKLGIHAIRREDLKKQIEILQNLTSVNSEFKSNVSEIIFNLDAMGKIKEDRESERAASWGSGGHGGTDSTGNVETDSTMSDGTGKDDVNDPNAVVDIKPKRPKLDSASEPGHPSSPVVFAGRSTASDSSDPFDRDSFLEFLSKLTPNEMKRYMKMISDDRTAQARTAQIKEKLEQALGGNVVSLSTVVIPNSLMQTPLITPWIRGLAQVLAAMRVVRQHPGMSEIKDVISEEFLTSAGLPQAKIPEFISSFYQRAQKEVRDIAGDADLRNLNLGSTLHECFLVSCQTQLIEKIISEVVGVYIMDQFEPLLKQSAVTEFLRKYRDYLELAKKRDILQQQRQGYTQAMETQQELDKLKKDIKRESNEEALRGIYHDIETTLAKIPNLLTQDVTLNFACQLAQQRILEYCKKYKPLRTPSNNWETLIDREILSIGEENPAISLFKIDSSLNDSVVAQMVGAPNDPKRERSAAEVNLAQRIDVFRGAVNLIFGEERRIAPAAPRAPAAPAAPGMVPPPPPAPIAAAPVARPEATTLQLSRVKAMLKKNPNLSDHEIAESLGIELEEASKLRQKAQ